MNAQCIGICQKGFQVIGVDVSTSKVDALNRGENFIEDLIDEEVEACVKGGLLRATTDYSELEGAQVIFIAVPTPFNAHKDPDIGYIISAGQNLAPHLSKGSLVILKSTTFPGTTEDFLIPELNKGGLQAGRDY